MCQSAKNDEGKGRGWGVEGSWDISYSTVEPEMESLYQAIKNEGKWIEGTNKIDIMFSRT